MGEAAFVPSLTRSEEDGKHGLIQLGYPLLDAYLELVAARARPNTLFAQAFDLKVFFSVVGKDPTAVTSDDVLAFIRAQRQPRPAAPSLLAPLPQPSRI